MRRIREHGFTIIELMVATVVFSVVLLVLSGGLLQIGRMYYKGMTSSRTQEVARSVVDDVTQTIQMSGGTIVTTDTMPANGSVRGACIGSRRYSFILNQQLGGSMPGYKFVSDTIGSGCAAGVGGTLPRPATGANSMSTLSGDAQELLGEKMRLVDFRVTQNATNPQLYNIVVRVAFGDDDLLCDPSVSGDCAAQGVSSSVSSNSTNLTCKSNVAGAQFCAVSEIATTVEKRLR